MKIKFDVFIKAVREIDIDDEEILYGVNLSKIDSDLGLWDELEAKARDYIESDEGNYLKQDLLKNSNFYIEKVEALCPYEVEEDEYLNEIRKKVKYYDEKNSYV
ncbi:MAG: hypothetical protein K2F59_02465 [Eubacteriales bacterium]|nr:hypothetical protein [Eubacteriales bacterium]